MLSWRKLFVVPVVYAPAWAVVRLRCRGGQER